MYILEWDKLITDQGRSTLLLQQITESTSDKFKIHFAAYLSLFLYLTARTRLRRRLRAAALFNER